MISRGSGTQLEDKAPWHWGLVPQTDRPPGQMCAAGASQRLVPFNVLQRRNKTSSRPSRSARVAKPIISLIVRSLIDIAVAHRGLEGKPLFDARPTHTNRPLRCDRHARLPHSVSLQGSVSMRRLAMVWKPGQGGPRYIPPLGPITLTPTPGGHDRWLEGRSISARSP